MPARNRLALRLRGKVIVAVEPKAECMPIFAGAVVEGVRNGRGEWSTADSFLPLLPPGIAVFGTRNG